MPWLWLSQVLHRPLLARVTNASRVLAGSQPQSLAESDAHVRLMAEAAIVGDTRQGMGVCPHHGAGRLYAGFHKKGMRRHAQQLGKLAQKLQRRAMDHRSEEHTSELQSPDHLV